MGELSSKDKLRCAVVYAAGKYNLDSCLSQVFVTDKVVGEEWLVYILAYIGGNFRNEDVVDCKDYVNDFIQRNNPDLVFKVLFIPI